MSKFKIGDRVKFHMDGYPREDDTGTVCLGAYEVSPGYYWVKWDGDGEVQQSSEMCLTLIESPDTEALPPSFKIDVQAYADENNISLEQAHNEIQPWLFEQGCEWYYKATEAQYKTQPYILFNCGRLNYLSYSSDEDLFNITLASVKRIFLFRNVSVSLSGKEEETVEILGKKYLKSDVENAMKNVKEKE